MGACSSADDNQEHQVSRAIDKAIRIEKAKLTQQYKLLLLGSGESGKSTFFKQMKIISSNLSEKDRAHFKVVIRKNCISQMQLLLRSVPLAGFEIQPETTEAAEFILGLDEENEEGLREEVTRALKTCWNDRATVLTFQKRGTRFQLNDALDYFFENIDRFADTNFEPTENDILRARIRTTGIEEAGFTINDFSFRLIDVGGQRSERRKWLHCFDSVTGILYFVALNEFDMFLREDDTANRMIDSLALFEGVCNSPWFKDVTFVLLLNKTDLFREKIEHTDLKICFPEYTGGRNFSTASEFVKQRFVGCNKSPHDIFVHFIVALDTDNVRLVFEATKQSVLARAISRNYGLTVAEASGGTYM